MQKETHFSFSVDLRVVETAQSYRYTSNFDGYEHYSNAYWIGE